MSLHPFKRCCRCEYWDDSNREKPVPLMSEHGLCVLNLPFQPEPVWMSPDQGCSEWELSTEIANALANDLEFPRSERL